MLKKLILLALLLLMLGCTRLPAPKSAKSQPAKASEQARKLPEKPGAGERTRSPAPRTAKPESVRSNKAEKKQPSTENSELDSRTGTPPSGLVAQNEDEVNRERAAAKPSPATVRANVAAAESFLIDNTNDPSRFEVVRIREGSYKAIPNGAWSHESTGGITALDRVEWLDTMQWNGSPYVWVKYREANPFGGLVLRDKTFIFGPKGMRVTVFPPEDIWRSERVDKVMTPEESDSIQAASDRTLGDLFSLKKKYQDELKQQKKR